MRRLSQDTNSRSQNEFCQPDVGELASSKPPNNSLIPSLALNTEVRRSNNQTQFANRTLLHVAQRSKTDFVPKSYYQFPKLLTIAEVARCLALSETTIRRMIEAGNLAVIRIGRSVRINPEVIENIMRQNE